MRLAAHPKLDALCGEYLLGTLRGAARRRFVRALASEPVVASRLQYWEQLFTMKYSEKFAVQPSPANWQRIKRDLGLHRFAPPWHARLWLWRAWAAVATVVLVVAIAVHYLNIPAPAAYATIAVMEGKAPGAQVTVELSSDGRSLRLRGSRPVQAAASQSFELWLIPPDGTAPQSLAVMGALDAQVRLAAALAGRLVHGAKLAVSVEPPGGSPTGAPTGPVIAIGPVAS